MAGYVGYESTVVFAEEVRDPKRTVARATYLALGVIAGLYGLSAWAMSVATGPDRIAEQARAYRTDLYFHLAAQHLPAPMVDAGRLLLLTSVFAALLAFHNMITRYGFALGRDRVLPAALARTGRTTQAPTVASLLQTTLAGVVIVGFAVEGWDPIRHLFFWLGVTGGFGVLILMTATCAAILAYFTRHPDETRWRRRTAPSFALGLLGTILVLTVAGFGDLLDAPGSPAAWAFPAGFAVIAVAGAAWGALRGPDRPDPLATTRGRPTAAKVSHSAVATPITVWQLARSLAVRCVRHGRHRPVLVRPPHSEPVGDDGTGWAVTAIGTPRLSRR